MYKTIEVYPKPGIICHTEAVWQWDHGDMIHLNDVDLPLSYKAEFSNVPVYGTAKPLILTGDSFEIPAEYQESGEPVYIWIVYVDDASRETVLSIITPVNARSKPVDEPFTPQEQSEADQAIAALNNGVERVEQIADTIQDTIDEAHPEGLLSNMAGYPKSFDSMNYDNNTDRTFEVAEAGYRTAESAMLMDTNPVRVMHVITLDRADGQRIHKRRKGDFPVWPEPEGSTEE